MSAYNPIAMMQKLEAGGVPHRQAETLADGLGEIRADLATKSELQVGLATAREDFKAEVKLLRADFRADLNGMALRLFLGITGIVALATAGLGFLISLHQVGASR